MRGADLIASTVRDSAKFRMLVVNLYHAGKPVEAAYKVYRRHRRADYERMPLLAALAQTGYYEARYFGETYGDEALNLLEALSGLATAQRLRPFLGNVLSLWQPNADRQVRAPRRSVANNQVGWRPDASQ